MSQVRTKASHFAAILRGGPPVPDRGRIRITSSLSLISRRSSPVIFSSSPGSTSLHLPRSRPPRGRTGKTSSKCSSTALAAHWTNPVSLEHGLTESMQGGACISHAHLHLSPAEIDVVSEIPADGIELSEINDQRDIPARPGEERPNLYAGAADGSAGFAWVDQIQIPRQYVRKLAARARGLGDPDWDSEAAVDRALLRSTVTQLKLSPSFPIQRIDLIALGLTGWRGQDDFGLFGLPITSISPTLRPDCCTERPPFKRWPRTWARTSGDGALLLGLSRLHPASLGDASPDLQRLVLSDKVLDIESDLFTAQVDAIVPYWSRLSPPSGNVRRHHPVAERHRGCSRSPRSRDVGTAIIPEAPHKLFLTADPALRLAPVCSADRTSQFRGRVGWLLWPQPGGRQTLEAKVLRPHLEPAADALVIDTSSLMHRTGSFLPHSDT